MKPKNKIILTAFFIANLSLSTPTYAAPWSNCLDVIKKVVGLNSSPEEVLTQKAHPSFFQVKKDMEAKGLDPESFPFLPEVEQSLKTYKTTGLPYIEYFYNPKAHNSLGAKEFINNTIEVVYTPHASRFGHIRVRVGNKLYGFENVRSTFMRDFDASVLFKPVRQIKKVPGQGDGRKEGNIGVVFALTPEMKQVFNERLQQIQKFYKSSQDTNVPPFDSAGVSNIKLIVGDNGQLTYKSPTSKSNFGNHGTINGKIINSGDGEVLLSESGYRHPIKLNEKGERIVTGYSCASSVYHVLGEIMGMNVPNMAYATGFKTFLKNGNEGGTSPVAVIHYYPSSDL